MRNKKAKKIKQDLNKFYDKIVEDVFPSKIFNITPIETEPIKLRFVKDTNVHGIMFDKGKIITYKPWHYEWRGMCEQERVKKGLYVECLGHGEFSVLREGLDVERVNHLI